MPDDEESLWMLSLGEKEVDSSFDEKEDEAKDGLLHLFNDEEGFLWISLEIIFEMCFCEGNGIGRVSHPLIVWSLEFGTMQDLLKSNSSMEE